jgi:hypothetical protein
MKTFAEKLLVDYLGWPELPPQWRSVIDHPSAWEVIIAKTLNGALPRKGTAGYDVEFPGDRKLEVKCCRRGTRGSGTVGTANISNVAGKENTLFVILSTDGTQLEDLFFLTREELAATGRDRFNIPSCTGKINTKQRKFWASKKITLEQLFDLYA